MDPITVLQNRIEQLEAKLGLAAQLAPPPEVIEQYQQQPTQQQEQHPQNQHPQQAQYQLQAPYHTDQESQQRYQAPQHQHQRPQQTQHHHQVAQHLQHVHQNQALQQQQAQEPQQLQPAPGHEQAQHQEMYQHQQAQHQQQSYGLNHQQGDSITANLLTTAQAINNATAGHEKLTEARIMASELNNYTDPNFVQTMQKKEMQMQEVQQSEPVVRHHCACMHRCKQAAPVLDSEILQQVPQMASAVNNMAKSVASVKSDNDAVSQGIQQLAETVGVAASKASEDLANVAQKVEVTEEAKFPRRRNGLDD